MDREKFYERVRDAYEKDGIADECTQQRLCGHWGHYCNPEVDFPNGVIGYLPNGLSIVANPKRISSYIQTENDENAPMDVKVAKKLLQVYNSSQKRGLEFNLTHTSVRNMLLAKKCYYTGITLTKMNGEPIPTDRTIDRKDPSKGYVMGNVVACSHVANQFKNTIERQFDGVLTRKQVIKVIQKMFED